MSQALSSKLISDAQASTLVEAPAITRSDAERRVAVEIDGFRFHGHRQAFEDDKRKALALESSGIRVIRLSWRQLVREPELVVASLARLL